MSQPTLVYSGSTVTLPYPSATSPLSRQYAELGGERRTVTGALRRWQGPYWYVYAASWEYCDRATYDSLVTLVREAGSANAFPTFTWADGPWLSATAGVAVSVAVSPMRPGGPLFGYVNFDVTFTESTART